MSPAIKSYHVSGSVGRIRRSPPSGIYCLMALRLSGLRIALFRNTRLLSPWMLPCPQICQGEYRGRPSAYRRCTEFNSPYSCGSRIALRGDLPACA
ncbi:hypothetical protein CKO_04155 [Citrobacter koseri ATCC BAA-895]|uniref:Uncharacterized protein n=1 Tax=Citrobacter koseri (strain ATCC BAA-895 / CDC 4225-83 / SGSC4696) TaxID=290338 RepID=A8AP07_CITK8|nr:hypothetical protein CKO_04155 [Citrobacter koseri ATCC BAA-895]